MRLKILFIFQLYLIILNFFGFLLGNEAETTNDVSSKSQIAYHILKPSKEDQDPFTLLTESDLQAHWSNVGEGDQKEPLVKKLEKIEHDFEEKIYLQVTLVGFENEKTLKLVKFNIWSENISSLNLILFF